MVARAGAARVEVAWEGGGPVEVVVAMGAAAAARVAGVGAREMAAQQADLEALVALVGEKEVKQAFQREHWSRTCGQQERS